MKSSKLAIAALLGAASVLASLPSAMAADPDYDYTGWYAKGGGGWNHVDGSSIPASIFPGSGGAPSTVYGPSTLKWRDGWGVLGGGGYRFDHSFRIEGELGYRQNGLHELTGFPGASGGRLDNYSAMMNALFDFDVAHGISLTAGAGVGAVKDDYRIYNSTAGMVVDGGNYSFGYQAIGGVNFDLAPHWQAFVEYHYMDATETKARGASGATYKPGDTNHLIAVGLKYFFGEPPPPPPPPVAAPAPPPPPPPPPPPQAPVPRNYLVFFDFDKSDITPEAHKIIVAAVEAAKKTNTLKITVTGHTDTVGTAKYNMALSLRRANAVKAELESLGYKDHEIDVIGKGFTQPLVPTGPQVREPQNRRAEIVLQ